MLPRVTAHAKIWGNAKRQVLPGVFTMRLQDRVIGRDFPDFQSSYSEFDIVKGIEWAEMG